jgi:rSAM/selenodomain-associated transferase 1
MKVRAAIFARYPEAGRCKTRLVPALGPEGAAKMHRRLAEHTVGVVRQCGLSFELWGTGADEAAFTDWLGPLTFRQQPDGGLGERLKAAAMSCPVLFLGTDCPGITPALLKDAAGKLSEGENVLGPAHDGGYWTLGLTKPADHVLTDMPWGTERVFELTKARLEQAGTPPFLLPTLHDVDRPEDLAKAEELLA